MLINEATSILLHGSVTPFAQQAAEHQAINNPELLFKEARLPDDYCFVTHIQTVMVTRGFSPETQTNFAEAKIVIDARQMRPIAQRVLMNRFFRTQMLSVRECDSINERSCLIDNGEYQDWMRLFEETVVPFLIQNCLPKKLF